MQKAPSKQGTHFYKLHGAGNDLLVLHTKELPVSGKAAFIRAIAHRQLGIGCDQVVEILSLSSLSVQMWNQDGSKAEMCANGARVFLFLSALEGWIDKKEKAVPIRISGRPYEGLRTTQGNYEICLGAPEISESENLKLDGKKIPFWPVRTGNPHAVIFIGDGPYSWKASQNFSYLNLGPQIESHPRFPQRTNVEFVSKLRMKGKKAEVDVQVWERGAGATFSCGSGAVAVAAVVRRLSGAEQVQVNMTAFKLQIRFEGDRAFLSGPSALVAKGKFCL